MLTVEIRALLEERERETFFTGDTEGWARLKKESSGINWKRLSHTSDANRV